MLFDYIDWCAGKKLQGNIIKLTIMKIDTLVAGLIVIAFGALLLTDATDYRGSSWHVVFAK